MEGNLKIFSSQSYSPNPPLPTQPFPDKKWVKQILIIVFVALLSSGATYFMLISRQKQTAPQQNNQAQFFPSPTPDPTVNWLTYTNKDLNFSLKYPVTWGVWEKNDKEIGPPIAYPSLKRTHEILLAVSELIEFYKPTPQKTTPEKTVTPKNSLTLFPAKGTQVLIEVYENPNRLSLKEILNEIDSTSLSHNEPGVSSQSVLINDVEGIRRTINLYKHELPEQEIVFVEKGDRFYEFILNFVTDTHDMETVNQILSSIKFLE